MQINLIFVEKELKMAVTPDPGGWISGSNHAGKEAQLDLGLLWPVEVSFWTSI